eukprot:Platyproteum_vivax@DN9425_c0_g1_i1.p1
MMRFFLVTAMISLMIGTELVLLGCYNSKEGHLCPRMGPPLDSFMVRSHPFMNFPPVQQAASSMFAYFKHSPHYDLIIMLGLVASIMEKVMLIGIIVEVLFYVVRLIIKPFVFIFRVMSFLALLLGLVIVCVKYMPLEDLPYPIKQVFEWTSSHYDVIWAHGTRLYGEAEALIRQAWDQINQLN